MKYKVNEKLVESFKIESVKVEHPDKDSSMRRWIASGLFFIFITLIVGGLILSFKNNDSNIFKVLLSTTTPFVSMAIGYYFGKQGDK